jgi:hypothetical protein
MLWRRCHPEHPDRAGDLKANSDGDHDSVAERGVDRHLRAIEHLRRDQGVEQARRSPIPTSEGVRDARDEGRIARCWKPPGTPDDNDPIAATSPRLVSIPHAQHPD